MEAGTMTQGARMTVLALYNQAGGSGKTSVTRDLGYALSKAGKRVLLIDADSQASLTRWLGLFQPGQTSSAESPRASLKDVLEGNEDTLPQPFTVHGMDVIASNRSMRNVELQLLSDPLLMGGLHAAIQKLQGRYDYVLIDTPPADNALVLACIAACDLLLMPVTGSKGLDNINNVAKVIANAQTINPHVRFGMFVVTSYQRNLNHDREVLAALKGSYRVLGPTAEPITFRPGIFKDAPNAKQPVAVFSPKSDAVSEFALLAVQVMGQATAGQAAAGQPVQAAAVAS